MESSKGFFRGSCDQMWGHIYFLGQWWHFEQNLIGHYGGFKDGDHTRLVCINYIYSIYIYISLGSFKGISVKTNVYS